MPDWKMLVRERLAPLRMQAAAESALADEIAQHLEDHYRELRSGGASEEEAYQDAISELDDMYPLQAELERSQRMSKYDAVPAGDIKPGNFMEDLWRDLRYAVRTMRNVLEACRGAGARCVYTSTLSTIGRPEDGRTLADERDLYVPGSVDDTYFEAKWARRTDPLAFSGVWRFRDLLPFAPPDRIVTVGEGQTLLQRADAPGGQ